LHMMPLLMSAWMSQHYCECLSDHLHRQQGRSLRPLQLAVLHALEAPTVLANGQGDGGRGTLRGVKCCAAAR
jgi:hypothetical protein